MGRASPFTRSYLLEAHPVSFAKNMLIIGFDPEFEDHLGLVDNARNHTLLQTKLAELGHANAQIKFIKAERPADCDGGTADAGNRRLPRPRPARRRQSAPPPAATAAAAVQPKENAPSRSTRIISRMIR